MRIRIEFETKDKSNDLDMLGALRNLIKTMFETKEVAVIQRKFVTEAPQESIRTKQEPEPPTNTPTTKVIDKISQIIRDDTDIQYRNYQIKMAGDKQVDVGKRMFFIWANRILAEYPAAESVVNKIRMLAANGVSRHVVYRAIEWSDIDVQQLEHVEDYPYLMKQWNMYFGKGNPYSPEYDKEEESRKAEIERLFGKTAVRQERKSKSTPLEQVFRRRVAIENITASFEAFKEWMKGKSYKTFQEAFTDLIDKHGIPYSKLSLMLQVPSWQIKQVKDGGRISDMCTIEDAKLEILHVEELDSVKAKSELGVDYSQYTLADFSMTTKFRNNFLNNDYTKWFVIRLKEFAAERGIQDAYDLVAAMVKEKVNLTGASLAFGFPDITMAQIHRKQSPCYVSRVRIHELLGFPPIQDIPSWQKGRVKVAVKESSSTDKKEGEFSKLFCMGRFKVTKELQKKREEVIVSSFQNKHFNTSQELYDYIDKLGIPVRPFCEMAGVSYSTFAKYKREGISLKKCTSILKQKFNLTIGSSAVTATKSVTKPMERKQPEPSMTVPVENIPSERELAIVRTVIDENGSCELLKLITALNKNIKSIELAKLLHIGIGAFYKLCMGNLHVVPKGFVENLEKRYGIKIKDVR